MLANRLPIALPYPLLPDKVRLLILQSADTPSKLAALADRPLLLAPSPRPGVMRPSQSLSPAFCLQAMHQGWNNPDPHKNSSPRYEEWAWLSSPTDEGNNGFACLFHETRHAARHQNDAAHQSPPGPAWKNKRLLEIKHVFP